MKIHLVKFDIGGSIIVEGEAESRQALIDEAKRSIPQRIEFRLTGDDITTTSHAVGWMMIDSANVHEVIEA